MSAYYFDSSALVKYYAQEIGTTWGEKPDQRGSCQ